MHAPNQPVYPPIEIMYREKFPIKLVICSDEKFRLCLELGERLLLFPKYVYSFEHYGFPDAPRPIEETFNLLEDGLCLLFYNKTELN